MSEKEWTNVKLTDLPEVICYQDKTFLRHPNMHPDKCLNPG